MPGSPPPVQTDVPLVYDTDHLAAAAREARLRLVVLYGAHATGQVDEESALDVAVLAGDRRVDAWALYDALAPVFSGHRLDLALLDDAGSRFRHEVMRTARLLYGDLDLFYEQAAYAYRAFADSAHLRVLGAALSRKKLYRPLRAAA